MVELRSLKGPFTLLPVTNQSSLGDLICRHKYSYDIIDDEHWLKPLEGAGNNTDWTVHLWFKNFLFKYEAEYVVCNWTCLIGEVGGNLGFFLGGSILAFSDLLLRSAQDRFERRWS